MIDSPCNNICKINPENGLCLGCARTSKEITNWSIYTEEEKKNVLKEIKFRNNVDKNMLNMLKK